MKKHCSDVEIEQRFEHNYFRHLLGHFNQWSLTQTPHRWWAFCHRIIYDWFPANQSQHRAKSSQGNRHSGVKVLIQNEKDKSSLAKTSLQPLQVASFWPGKRFYSNFLYHFTTSASVYWLFFFFVYRFYIDLLGELQVFCSQLIKLILKCGDKTSV